MVRDVANAWSAPPRERGKTPYLVSGSTTWDHPRERGEDARRTRVHYDRAGPPPRARGRRAGRQGRPAPRGTTPASAGKTQGGARQLRPFGDHPRERGEDPTTWVPYTKAVGPPPRAREDSPPRFRVPGVAGPPPRARGRPAMAARPRAPPGTTPASAGSTFVVIPDHRPDGDHPRERGEHTW